MHNRIITTGTEDTEKIFCLSGDLPAIASAQARRAGTDKQKIPALTALHAQPYEEIAPLIPYLHGPLHEESRIMNLIQEVLFVYRHLPIDENLSLSLCVLSATVVNFYLLQRPLYPKASSSNSAL